MSNQSTLKTNLIRETQKFAHDFPLRSWAELAVSFPPFIFSVWMSAQSELSFVWRFLASVIAGLVMMRIFVIYHDYQHGAILRESKLAKIVMPILGTLLLRSPYDWRRSHNYHHQHNCQFESSEVGSFKLMSVAEYQAMSPKSQLIYRIIRNPLVIVFGYITCFLLEAVKKLFFKDNNLKIQSAIALTTHIAIGYFAWTLGADVFLFSFFLPFLITCATGVYLFYIQHNFPTATFRNGDSWSHEYAALNSSSMMVSGPIFRWFSANIGYHHIHHLNHRIPFYRLPEAMNAIPELQNPKKVNLSPSMVFHCLKLKLWDEKSQKLVYYPQS